MKFKRSDRGFIEFGHTVTRWHGRLEVKESSVAFEGPCVWVFTDLSYSNTPQANAPHLHLSLDDAKNLRDLLGKFIFAATHGATCEAPRKGKK